MIIDDENEANKQVANNKSESNGMDEKKKKFIELAESRVTKAIHSINLVANLSNRSSYHYEPRQVKEIIDELESAVEKLKIRFNPVETDKKVAFSFKLGDQ